MLPPRDSATDHPAAVHGVADPILAQVSGVVQQAVSGVVQQAVSGAEAPSGEPDSKCLHQRRLGQHRPPHQHLAHRTQRWPEDKCFAEYPPFVSRSRSPNFATGHLEN